MPASFDQPDLPGLVEAERLMELLRLKIANAKAAAKPEDADALDDIELALGWAAKKLAKLRRGSTSHET